MTELPRFDHWADDPLYPHMFELMTLSTHAGQTVQWCRTHFGASDKTMTFDQDRQCLAMIPTGAHNGWYHWGNTRVYFQSLDDALIFKLTRG